MYVHSENTTMMLYNTRSMLTVFNYQGGTLASAC